MIAVLFIHFNSCFHYRPCLHTGNFRISHRKTAASVSHHGIEFMQAVTGSLYFRDCKVHISCQIFKVFFLCGNEFMKRRIQETDGNRVVLHHLIDALEITLLERNQLIQSLFSRFTGSGKDHFADLRDTIGIKEHMLRTAEPDSFRTQLKGIGSVLRRVRIGTYLQHAERIRPIHNTAEIAADGCIFRCNIPVIYLSGGTIKGNVIPFVIGPAAQAEYLGCFIHNNITAAGNTCGSHTSGYYGRMGSHSPAYGKDTFCGMHSFDILRRGLQTYQNDSFTFFMRFFGIFSSKIYFACGSAGRSRKGLSNHFSCFECIRFKGRMQKLVQRFGFNSENSLFRGYHTFAYQVTGNLQSGRRSSLSVSCLQEIQFAFFYGKFHILHVPVVSFQFICDFYKLFIAFRKILFQTGDRLGSPDSGNNIFALCINQIFTVDPSRSGRRVPCKSNSRSGCVSHIAEYHGLYVDRGSPVSGDVIHAAVHDSALIIP